MEQVLWSPGMTLDALEQVVIIKAYRFYRNNKTATANSLGISIRTLDSKLEKYEETTKAEELANADRRREREINLARARGTQPPTAIFQAQAGVRVESVDQPPAQQQMSMPQRAEVQEMLPRQVAASSAGKRR